MSYLCLRNKTLTLSNFSTDDRQQDTVKEIVWVHATIWKNIRIQQTDKTALTVHFV